MKRESSLANEILSFLDGTNMEVHFYFQVNEVLKDRFDVKNLV